MGFPSKERSESDIVACPTLVAVCGFFLPYARCKKTLLIPLSFRLFLQIQNHGIKRGIFYD